MFNERIFFPNEPYHYEIEDGKAALEHRDRTLAEYDAERPACPSGTTPGGES